MTAMLTLDLALITFGPDGIRRVGAMNLPRIDGVHYVVSWQCGGDAAVPASLIRPDISVCRTQKPGRRCQPQQRHRSLHRRHHSLF